MLRCVMDLMRYEHPVGVCPHAQCADSREQWVSQPLNNGGPVCRQAGTSAGAGVNTKII